MAARVCDTQAMPKRSSKRFTPQDLNRLAARIVEEATKAGEKPKDPLAVELGRRGGLKGGKARAEKLSAKRRSKIAKEAARARWAKRRLGRS
jgi:hypothetical protein